MMMRCLEAGGMPVAYDDSQEELNSASGTDYIPNPNGFYALDIDFDDPGFLAAHVGKAFKYPFRSLTALPAGFHYNLLFMKRNPDEIRASMAAFTPLAHWGPDTTILEFYDVAIDAIIDKLRARGDFNILVLQYEDVVKDPARAFAQLAAAGWPVAADFAAEKVDPSLHRFRLERA